MKKNTNAQAVTLNEVLTGMKVESWERRENSRGGVKVYVRFAPKRPEIGVHVTQG